MRASRYSLVASGATLASLLALATATAQSDRLGTVEFKVGCNAEAQQRLNRAMSFYHSFARDSARKAFHAVLAADPKCGMAHWGQALTNLDNPFIWPSNLGPAVMKKGADALRAARETGLADARDRAYVDALERLHADHDKLDHRTRAKALEDALARIASDYPSDTEASILHALVLSANFDPSDKNYGNQLAAARILEPIFARQPDHPGVAHYLIHSYDYPPIAGRGLDAARRYAKIAPGAPHALHMPSHIFTRVGDWRASVESNASSASSAPEGSMNRMHAYDYMVYAHLQGGEDAAAARVIAESQMTSGYADNFAVAFALAAMPARLALERGVWQEAAGLSLTPPPGAYPWDKYPQAEAINAFARGVGAAKSGDAAAARAEAQRLRTLRDRLVERKLGYWVEQVSIQALAVDALATWAEGNKADGIAQLREAATREDATEKHAVVPGPLLPARELLAALLVESGAAAEGLAEYEATLAKEPNRLRAVLGAAQAAERAGDPVKSKRYTAQAAELTRQAQPGRAEIARVVKGS